MNNDIRLSLGFFTHPKTIKLQRRLGLEGVFCLQRLWCFTAQHRCSGILSDMDSEELAIAAGWVNDVTTFVTTLVQLRWLDDVDGVYRVHDWLDHNGFASSADDRSDKARFSRMAKTHNAIYTELKASGVDAITATEYKRLTAANHQSTNVERSLNETLDDSLKETSTERTSPSPSPSPSPLPSPLPSVKPINLPLPPEDKSGGAFYIERMSMSEIQELHIMYLGRIPHNQPLVTVLQEICKFYPPDRIKTAFQAAAATEKQKNLNWVRIYLDNPKNWSTGNGKFDQGRPTTAGRKTTGIIPPNPPETDWLGGSSFDTSGTD